MQRYGSIYLITNTLDGKKYVGLTRLTPEYRFTQHKYKAHGENPKYWLHRAIKKYGDNAFALEELFTAFDKEALVEAEKHFIRILAPEYNQANGGEGTGHKIYSQEARERIRQSNLGKKRTVEQCERNRQQKLAYYERNPEAREKFKEVGARALASVNQEKRIAAVRSKIAGVKWPPERRAKLSASCMGRKYGPEIIAKMAATKRKPVYCVNTQVCYIDAKEAATAVGVGHRSVIRVLKKQYPHVKGFVFEYGASDK